MAITQGLDRASVQQDKLLDDREAKTESTELAGGALVGLCKRLEHQGKEVG